MDELLAARCPQPVLHEFQRAQLLAHYASTLPTQAQRSDETMDQCCLRLCTRSTCMHHPRHQSLYMVQVNITDDVLPPGLLSPEFPPTFADVELSTANLCALPGDLGTKWPTGGALMFEYSEFTSIPDVVKRLLPSLLSFCGNPIDKIPAELFAVESIYFLHIGGKQRLKALPANTTLLSTLGQFYLKRT